MSGGLLRSSPVAGLPEIGEGMDARRADRASAPSWRRATSSSSRRRSSPRPRGGCAGSPRCGRAPKRATLAAELDKDPALVELVLAESREVLRAERGVLIAETRHGLVCANAGIDSSNLPERRHASACCPRTPTPPPAGSAPSCARPAAPDGRRRSSPTASAAPGAWARPRSRSAAPGSRRSTTGAGGATPSGRELEATQIAIADQAAAAADLVRDKASGMPVAIVRGLGRITSAPRTVRGGGPAPPARRGPLPLAPGAAYCRPARRPRRSRRSRRASCAAPATRPAARAASISCSGSSRTPCWEPAIREMFSSISVPPRSLTPQRSASVAAPRPIFTQLACRLGIVLPSASRKAAVCLRFSARRDLLDPVGAAEHRVEGDEAERHELGDPAGPFLQRRAPRACGEPARAAPRCGRTSPSRSSAGPPGGRPR